SKDICDKANYLNILYNQVAKVNFHSLVNTFNNSLTKNRIIMITKNKTSRKSAFKLLIAVPLTLMLLGIFSINYVYSSTNEEQAVIVEEQVLPELNEPEPLPEIEKPIAELPTKPQSVAQSDTTVHFIVDVQPKFPGGEAERLKYLRENVKYPQESKDNNSSGTVYVQFVIEKDGSVSNVKLMRGVDEYIDKEAIRVISEMPKWTPGTDKKGNPLRVQFAMQIKFTLDASKNEDKKE
ncbi:energy transducer TonB, partial [Bacteroidales bacterium OttesenSCG-928-K03]|nr:energy transducer TonB [Bacteroidales bacterium OttesenSCG-928-K03]